MAPGNCKRLEAVARETRGNCDANVLTGASTRGVIRENRRYVEDDASVRQLSIDSASVIIIACEMG